ncbi:MAG TPA: transcription antitermination factor NusB [Thermoanaerobaculia bacterium]|nr:transcription antitermination factor NusB [Thermoanaerobaculia bacterium]
MAVNERQRALDVLRRIERESLYASIALLGESGFVRTLVLGVLRWRSRLDHAIETFAARKLNKIDSLTVDVLRIGVYQLHFMDVAKYAAVSETVNMAPKRARGFVNALLRRAAEGLPQPPDTATRYAHPHWLFDRWSRTYGADRAARIAEANQQLSYPDVLALSGPPPPPAAPSTLVDGIYKLSESTAELDRTDFYPMDEGSAVIAAIATNAGEEILDMAAAPGGKTLYAKWCGARVTSSDVSIRRLQPLVGRQRRLLVADGRRPPFRKRFPVVLLDAPCSATGTIRKNPEIKWRLREDDIRQFAKLQRELLESALGIGETVMYSTCSLEPEENDAVVSGLKREDITPLVPEGARRWVDDGVLRLTPESGADGFTCFVLRSR